MSIAQDPIASQSGCEISLPYGNGTVEGRLARGRVLGTIDIADAPEVPDREAAIRRALDAPIGQREGVLRRVRAGEKVLILVSDAYRQTRADEVLPVLLAGLNAAGVPDSHVTIQFANGTHRPPNDAEQRAIVGPAIYARLASRLHVHDPRDEANLTEIGVTRRGTRVRINSRLLAADRVIVTGAVVLHYFGGYGGGRKSILPGVSAVDSIAHNHAMNILPGEDLLNADVRIGGLDGNPVAEDMLEAAKLAPVDCIVNTVLNRHNRIAGIFAGDLEGAHRAAAKFAKGLFACPIAQRADLVIAASAATKNFVQTHKALYNAFQAMAPGGRIILAAPCPEGLGGDAYTKWLKLGTRAAVFAGLRKQSEIYGQTALSTIEKAPSAFMVTEMSDDDVTLMQARKAESFQEALDRATAELAAAGKPDPTLWLMPSAAYSVPFA